MTGARKTKRVLAGLQNLCQRNPLRFFFRRFHGPALRRIPFLCADHHRKGLVRRVPQNLQVVQEQLQRLLFKSKMKHMGSPYTIS